MPWQSLKELSSSDGTVLLHDPTTAGTLILHPTPNPHDPNDPLRWPAWKKNTAFAAVCAFAFVTNVAIGGFSPAFPTLAQEFRRSQQDLSFLLLWPMLTLGLANFLWVPLANYLGKRPVFVFTTGLLALTYMWGAVAQSYKSLLWSMIIGAFAGSASEAVAAATVNDIFFLHQRAGLMGWYMAALANGNTIGPLVCGFVVQGSTWRVFKWIAFGLTTANFLVVLLFVPETRYHRPAGDTYASSPASYSESDQDIEKSTDGPRDITNHIDPRSNSDASEVPSDLTRCQVQVQQRSYWQDLAIFTVLPHNISLLKLFFRPIPLFLYPAVVVACLGFGVSLAFVVSINIFGAFVLQAPPYAFKPGIQALINIPGLLGNAFGAFIGGWCVDKYSSWKSKKNAGIFQPEMRLHLLIVPALLVPAGLIMFGYGVARRESWAVLFVGNGLVGVGLTAVPTMTMTYVSDAYLAVNADALTLVTGLKNVVSFGIIYHIVPWVLTSGFVAAFWEQAAIYIAIMLLAVPLAFLGEYTRRKTAQSRIILS